MGVCFGERVFADRVQLAGAGSVLSQQSADTP